MREKLKQARQAAGMTQQQVADKLGITVRYYGHIESGARTGCFAIWDSLEDILGINQRILRKVSSDQIIKTDLKKVRDFD